MDITANWGYVCATANAVPRMADEIERLREALAEVACWIPDGSRQTPEQRGCKCSTAYDVERWIARALGPTVQKEPTDGR